MWTGRQLAGALLAAAAVVASGARADDAFKWNPAERPAPRAGDKFCEELTKSDDRSLKFTRDGQPVERKEVGKESIRLLHAIAAASSTAVSEDRITVQKWSLATDRAVDSSLEDAIVTVKGEGAYRTFNAESERTISRVANRWIDSHLVKGGKRDPTLDELDWDFILPKEPAADGGTWTIDTAAFAREVMGPKATFDAKKSRGEGKLTGVRVEKGVHFGHVEVSVSLALDALGESPVTWAKGGVREFRYVLDLSLEPRRRDVVAAVITIELSGRGP